MSLKLELAAMLALSGAVRSGRDRAHALLLHTAAVVVLLGFACGGDELAAQQPTREDARYVASTRGQVYYWIGCDVWHSLSPRNLRYFRSATEAEGAGYRPSRSRGCAPQLDAALIRPTIRGTASCTVTRIVDGDTFDCEGGSRVRLILLNADESGRSMWADSAAALLQRLMPPGSRVRLEFDIELFDRWGRVLAYVRADSLLVNRELVRHGFARVAVYPPNVRLVEELRAAADSARMEGRGIWRGHCC